MVRRQAKKRRGIPLWVWLGWGSVGIISASAVALALSFTWTPLQQKVLSAADTAFFDRNGKEAFSRSLLQVPEVSKPVNILLLGIKTNISDLKNTDRKSVV